MAELRWSGRCVVGLVLLGCMVGMLSLTARGQRARVVYTDKADGFTFTLPADWKGFSVIRKTDELGPAFPPDAPPVAPAHPPDPPLTFRILVLRHPRWTEAHPRQDIPILIFTLAQWDAQEKGDSVRYATAAPFGPDELGRNARYVFALPPRFEAAWPDGAKEVQSLVGRHPLHAF